MSKAEKLIMACKDMTDILTLTPKIDIDDKVQMRLDLAEAAKLLKSSDMLKLKDETVAVLEKLGVELPKVEKKEKESKKPESKKPESKKPESKKPESKKELSPFGRRMNSVVGVIDSMTIKGATEKEIVDGVKKVFSGKTKESILERMKGHFIQLKKEGFLVNHDIKKGIYKVEKK